MLLTANIRKLHYYHFDNHWYRSNQLAILPNLDLCQTLSDAYQTFGHLIVLHFLSIVIHQNPSPYTENTKPNIIHLNNINIYIINYQFDMDENLCVAMWLNRIENKHWKIAGCNVDIHKLLLNALLFVQIKCTFITRNSAVISIRQLIGLNLSVDTKQSDWWFVQRKKSNNNKIQTWWYIHSLVWCYQKYRHVMRETYSSAIFLLLFARNNWTLNTWPIAVYLCEYVKRCELSGFSSQ